MPIQIGVHFQTPKAKAGTWPTPDSAEVTELVVRFARENSGWEYDRIAGALANLGHQVSDQTVGNILRRHDIAPAPKRSQTTTWKEFIGRHLGVLAGTDFFTVEVLTWRGLATYSVLFFLHLATRHVSLAGITRHPTEEWMTQMARNAVDEESGYLRRHRYAVHDRDTKFCLDFRKTLASGGVKCLQLPPRSPNLNAFAERWMRSVKSEAEVSEHGQRFLVSVPAMAGQPSSLGGDGKSRPYVLPPRGNSTGVEILVLKHHGQHRTPITTRRVMLRFSCIFLTAVFAMPAQSVLYNGIVLPAAWPPTDVAVTNEPQPDPPYLTHPPEVIQIDVGRQLFVDDFLIESTDLRRVFHKAQMYSGNPVVKGDKPWEAGHAMPYSDGVFWDPQDHIFKMWYRGTAGTLFATSHDGVHWDKPLLDVKPGTNTVEPAQHDSSTVWLDVDEPNPSHRYKMGYSLGHDKPFLLFESADGIHWGQPIARSIPTSDRVTFFKNPFRGIWVFSLRDHDWAPASTGGTRITDQPPAKYKDYIGRFRRYWESPKFETGATWKPAETGPKNPRIDAPAWAMADRLDPRSLDFNTQPELYNLDATPYESVLLGAFAIWPGQYEFGEKPNYLTIGYSRDGFHWYRPDRRPFIAPTGRNGDWDRGNIQSAGGVCLVVGDRLYFYFSGRAGIEGRRSAGDTSTGLATLRRDGFASMDADSTPRVLTTRRVRFTGKRLFVNVDSTAGEMRLEILDGNGEAIHGFSAAECIPLHVNNTLTAVRWAGGADLSRIAGTPVKLRFHLRDARLFSFWVSPDDLGASNGYVAAGGPGFTGSHDTVGTRSYADCCRPEFW